MKTLRILIADDHALLRRGARGVLNARRGWRVVGEAANGREAVEKAMKLKPDVAVVDIGMPEMDGVEVARQIRERVPETKILVLTMYESDQMVKRALAAGAHGYVLKSDLTEVLPKAVKVVSEGKRFLTPKVFEILAEGLDKTRGQREHGEWGRRATPRETEVVRLLAKGKTNKEIAQTLEIGVRTVEAHRANVMLKLGLRSIADLIHYAIREGLASSGESEVPNHTHV